MSTKNWAAEGNFVEGLRMVGACDEARRWVGQKSLRQAWNSCSPDAGADEFVWLGWLLCEIVCGEKPWRVTVAKLGLAYMGKKKRTGIELQLREELEVVVAGRWRPAKVKRLMSLDVGLMDDHLDTVLCALYGSESELEAMFLFEVRRHIKKCITVEKLEKLFNKRVREVDSYYCQHSTHSTIAIGY